MYVVFYSYYIKDIRWLNQIAKTPLLILDDFGLQPLDHNMKLALQIMEDRYAKGTTIITSQLPVWPEWWLTFTGIYIYRFRSLDCNKLSGI